MPDYGIPTGGRAFVTVDYEDALASYAGTMVESMTPLLSYAAYEAEDVLRYRVLPEIVIRSALRAGSGFPQSYMIHLSQEITNIVISTTRSASDVMLAFSIDGLGDWNDLMLGAHQNAMLKNEEGFKSFRKTTKSLLKKNPLPNKVGEEDLENTKDRRIEWWNAAIGGGANTKTNVGANWNWTRKLVRTPADAWDAVNVPDFEKVASDRINDAWKPIGVAPEWLLLQYGTLPGTLPIIRPQDFVGNIENVCECVFRRIMQQAMEDLNDRAIVATKVSGAYGGRGVTNKLGQYAKKPVALQPAAINIPDLSACFQLIY